MKSILYLSEEFVSDLIYGTREQKIEQMINHPNVEKFTTEEFVEKSFNGELEDGTCVFVDNDELCQTS